MNKRIKGGDKNEKSGKVWSRSELEKVLELYFKLGGKALHESNPEIILLGQKLQRTTRSVEAQLLMFRNRERFGAYGYKNMNHIINELWNQHHKQNPKMESLVNLETNLDELLNWSGHRKGGVKIAFTDRGLPTGKIVKTDLIEAIDDWVRDLEDMNKRSLNIFFIGGPGNGKTEALEYSINTLFSRYNISNDVKEEIKLQASNSRRKIEVNIDNTELPFKKIILIQDASLGNITKSPALSMLDDFINIIDQDILFICCINRGVLQDVVFLAKSMGKACESNFYSELASCMDTTPEFITNSWPKRYEFNNLRFLFSVWPMEVSSLFDSHRITSDNSPFEQIVEIALSRVDWEAFKRVIMNQQLNIHFCPFLINYENFKNNTASNIKKIFEEYELITNRRITFREIQSLVTYLLLGHEDDFIIDGKRYSIEEYTTFFMKKIQNSGNKIEYYEALFKLAMFQTEFKMFRTWPDLSPLSNERTWKSTLDSYKAKGVFSSCIAFNKIFSKPIDTTCRTDIEKTIKQLELIMDPGKLSSNDAEIELFNPEEIDLYLQDSVASAVEKIISNQGFSEIDKEVLNFFMFVESDLNEIRLQNNTNGINSTLERINLILRKIVSTYIKRKLGCYYGHSSESFSIKKYNTYNIDNESIISFICDFLEINNSIKMDGKYVGYINIRINSTFGQPDFYIEEDIRFQSTVKYNVSVYKPTGYEAKQPVRSAKFLKLTVYSNDNSKEFHIPFTFHLYQAIEDIRLGLKKGTMPRDVVATFDRMKSFLEGVVVHGDSDSSSIIFPKPQKKVDINKILNGNL